jgi:hypothetical protein
VKLCDSGWFIIGHCLLTEVYFISTTFREFTLLPL